MARRSSVAPGRPKRNSSRSAAPRPAGPGHPRPAPPPSTGGRTSRPPGSATRTSAPWPGSPAPRAWRAPSGEPLEAVPQHRDHRRVAGAELPPVPDPRAAEAGRGPGHPLDVPSAGRARPPRRAPPVSPTMSPEPTGAAPGRGGRRSAGARSGSRASRSAVSACSQWVRARSKAPRPSASCAASTASATADGASSGRSLRPEHEVVGHLRDEIGSRAPATLQRLPARPRGRGPDGSRQRGVQRLAHQRVGEAELSGGLGLLHDPRLERHLEALQHGLDRVAGHRGQRADLELPSQHRGDLQQAAERDPGSRPSLRRSTSSTPSGTATSRAPWASAGSRR